MTENQYIFVILRTEYILTQDGTSRFTYQVKALYTDGKEARQEFDKIPEEDDCEWMLEEWPVNTPKDRFNILVIATK